GVEESRIRVIYNGIVERFFAPLTRPPAANTKEELGTRTQELLDSGRPLLLVVGTIEPRKRHQLLLDALVLEPLASMDPKPLLVVAGQAGWKSVETIDSIKAAEERGDALWLTDVNDESLHALYT